MAHNNMDNEIDAPTHTPRNCNKIKRREEESHTARDNGDSYNNISLHSTESKERGVAAKREIH